MNSTASSEAAGLLCGNCCQQIDKTSGTPSIKLSKKFKGIDPTEVQIIDALAYIYGISWEEFQSSIKKQNYPGGCAKLTDDPSVYFCQLCSVLLWNNYTIHKEFETTSHPTSIVSHVNKFRERKVKSATYAQFRESNYNPPSQSPNHQNENTNTAEADSFDFEDTEEYYENILTDSEIEYKPECNLELQNFESEVQPTIHNSDCSDVKAAPSPASSHLKLRKVSVVVEQLSPEKLSNKDKGSLKTNNKNEEDELPKKKRGGPRGPRRLKEPFDPNCKICGKQVKTEKMMERHLYLYHDDSREPCICDTCGKKCVDKLVLKSHMKIHNEGRKRFLCGQCGKTFVSKQILKRHEYVHTGVADFPCDMCSKIFFTKTDLQMHRKYTHAERQYICDECGKTFKYSEHFKIHQRMHKELEENGGARIQCNECDKYFVHSHSLKKHKLRYHRSDETNVCVCDECGKTFKARCQLIYHKKIHEEIAENGGARIQCDQCGKDFKHKRSLDKHVREFHRSDLKKVYQCSVCDKILSALSSLKNHKKLVHKILPDPKW